MCRNFITYTISLLLILVFAIPYAGSATGSDQIRVYSIKTGDYIVTKKVEKSPEEWSKILAPDVFHITRQKGTEKEARYYRRRDKKSIRQDWGLWNI